MRLFHLPRISAPQNSRQVFFDLFISGFTERHCGTGQDWAFILKVKSDNLS
jgi:hypothetical protein